MILQVARTLYKVSKGCYSGKRWMGKVNIPMGATRLDTVSNAVA